MVLMQDWTPHMCLQPLAQVDPPMMPFRDAGYSQADFDLSIQDVVYGVYKAREERCCTFHKFNLEEYESFERVDGGDLNWITPFFVAFASPQAPAFPVERIPPTSELYKQLPRSLAAVKAHKLISDPFKCVLEHFCERGVGLVVRLNDKLYSSSFFESLGIYHLDMIFEDGTCPDMKTVRKFIKIAHEMITVKKRAIAVHCKAGLGRTGCLIGAYLIYRYGFTANEVIGYMRFMRPGMVVGPQQHWLHLNQGTFREWWVAERLERKIREKLKAAEGLPSTPVRAMQATSLQAATNQSTPPNRSASNRTPLSERENDRAAKAELLPVPTPGQPRKSARADRHHPYARSPSGSHATQEAEIHSVKRSSNGASASDEEIHLRMRVQRSPTTRERQGSRQVSSSVTSVTTTQHTTQTTTRECIDNDASHDVENLGASLGRSKSSAVAAEQPPQRSPSRAASGQGVLAKVRNAGAGADKAKRGAPSGVRKTSGRVGSVGGPTATAQAAARKVSGM
jgi:cell division cycle 14